MLVNRVCRKAGICLFHFPHFFLKKGERMKLENFSTRGTSNKTFPLQLFFKFCIIFYFVNLSREKRSVSFRSKFLVSVLDSFVDWVRAIHRVFEKQSTLENNTLV